MGYLSNMSAQSENKKCLVSFQKKIRKVFRVKGMEHQNTHSTRDYVLIHALYIHFAFKCNLKVPRKNILAP